MPRSRHVHANLQRLSRPLLSRDEIGALGYCTQRSAAVTPDPPVNKMGYIGWRGLFLVGLLPALLTLLIRAWVPESPRWLIRMSRQKEARESSAWAFGVTPKSSRSRSQPNPTRTKQTGARCSATGAVRSILINLSQTGGNGLLLWATTLFLLILNVTMSEDTSLMIWVSLSGFAGRLAFSYLSDAIGGAPAA